MPFDLRTSRLSRKQFLRGALAGGGAVILAACAPAAAPPAAPAAPAAPTTEAQPAEKPAESPTQAAAAAPAAEAVTLTHWVHPLSADDIAAFQPMIKRFQETNPNIKINIEITPWDSRIEKNMSAAAAGTSPDISYLNVDEFTTYVEQNALVQLDELVTKEDLDDLLPGPRYATDWNGHLYEFPVLYAFRIPVYNKKIWDAAGVKDIPIKWDQIDAAHQAVKDAKASGKVTAWPTTMETLGQTTLRVFNPWFYQSGGKILTPEGKSGYDSEAGIEAMKYSVHLFDDFCNPADKSSDGTENQAKFGRQEYAYDHNVELSFLKITKDEYKDVDIQVGHAQENKLRWTHGGVGNYGMWKKPTTHPAEAWKWIHWITKEGNLDYQKTFGFVPPRKSNLATYTEQADELHKAALAEAQYGGVEKHPRIWDMWEVMNAECGAAYLHEKTPEQAVKDAAARINTEYLKV